MPQFWSAAAPRVEGELCRVTCRLRKDFDTSRREVNPFAHNTSFVSAPEKHKCRAVLARKKVQALSFHTVTSNDHGDLRSSFASFLISFSRGTFTIPCASSYMLSRRSFPSRDFSLALSKRARGMVSIAPSLVIAVAGLGHTIALRCFAIAKLTY